MAITVTADTIASELDIDLTRATRLLSVASALVDDYCPEAPEPIANESVLMVCGMDLGQRGKPGKQSGRKVPDRSESPTPQSRKMPSNIAGAESLLSPFKVRRAMVIA